MHKKRLVFLIIFAVVLVGMWCLFSNGGRSGVKRAGEHLSVVTSGYVPYALAKEIGAEKIHLTMLVPPGTEPHHFEPTPGSVIAVNEADVFVYISPQVEPWVADILKGLGFVRALEAGPSEKDEDPHVWMTPYGALAMAGRIADTLAKADPSNAAYYRDNLKKFEKETELLHKDFAGGLKNCKSRAVVHVGHLAFGALAQTYRLELRSLSGTSHQGEHSVRKLADLIRFIRKHKVSAVFTEPFVSPELAQTVAQETHVRVLPLYTVEEVDPEDFKSGKTYQQFMRQNLKNLQEGLQCPAR